MSGLDLIKTIDDDEDVPLLSEDSGSEDEFQPTRKRTKIATTSGLNDIDFSQFSKDIWSEILPKLKRKAFKKSTLDDKIKKANKSKKSTNGLPTRENAAGEDVEIKSEEESSEDEIKKESDFEADSDDSISLAWAKKSNKKKQKLKDKKIRKGGEDDDDIELSDDEMKQDKIQLKGKKGAATKNKKKKKKDDEDELEPFDDSIKLENDPNISFETNMTFQQMSLSRPLMKAITNLGFVHPTPIQAAAISVALSGRDICGCAATGTGKTAAFMLPVLERLLYKPKANPVTRVLALVPTRELGVQVYTVTRQLCSFSSDIQIALAVGGLDLQAQEAILRKNPDIVIATPGRLIDHLENTPSFSLDSIEILILDEADRMLDDWFAEQLKEIIKQCSPRRQTLLFSATMTDKVKDLASVSLKNPVRIFVDSNKQVTANLRQQFVRVRNETDREALICALVVRTFHTRTMIFVPTKKEAHRLHIILGLFGVRIGELHGDLTQLQRLESLKKYQGSEFDVLIATDVAARGLDIPGVQSVINYTMPAVIEQYIHRCGRTARAGRSGVAVSLVGESDRKLMKQVAKSASLPVKSRIIPIEIVGKYRDKLISLEPKIKEVVAEEESEKVLAKAEIEANKAIKLLEAKKAKKKSKKIKKAEKDNDPSKRSWFQSHKERENEKTRLKGRPSAKERHEKAAENEDLKIKKLTEFQARSAKRQRRGGGGKETLPNGKHTSQGAGGHKKDKKQSGRKSQFDDELTNVKKAKEFRHKSRTITKEASMMQKKAEKKHNRKFTRKK